MGLQPVCFPRVPQERIETMPGFGRFWGRRRGWIMRDAAEKYKNWGKWGPNDEIGTLNYTSAEDVVAATRLVKKGKVISLALNFDHTGPQGAKSKYPSMGRTNPIHTMPCAIRS